MTAVERKRIRSYRRYTGLTQADLAHMVGCSVDTIRRIEQGAPFNTKPRTLSLLSIWLERAERAVTIPQLLHRGAPNASRTIPE